LRSLSADGSAETELLVSCARTRLDAEHAEGMTALLEHGIDQDRLIRMAGPHGLLPLLYWHLGAIGPGVVSSAMLSRLREHFEANARRNLFLTAELLKVLRLLEASEIPAVPFKGPLLAASTYGNLSLRQFADLDILVRKDDVPKAKELLISRGYRPPLALTGAQDAALLRSQSEYVFSSRDGKVVVELHWRFAPAYFSSPLDLDRLWDRLRWISLGGVQVRSLGPEDLLLVLCVHGSKHCWERLEWICGIAEVVRTQPTLDWPRVIEEAAREGSVRMLFLGLLLADQLLGAPIPEEVLRRARRDSGAQALAAEVRARLFRGTQRAPGMRETTWFHLRARERLADRIRYCLRLALTPTVGDFELVSLPATLYFLYYVLRPIRLARKYGSRRALRREC